MKRSTSIFLTHIFVSAMGLLMPALASAQVVQNQATRTLVIPGITPCAGVSCPDITGGSPLRDDCDTILLVPESDSRSGPGSVEIALQTGTDSGETWWKALELFVDGQRAQAIKAEGNGARSSDVLRIMPNELATAQVLFVKPKFLGVATGVYQVVGLERLANRRVTLLWRRDRC